MFGMTFNVDRTKFLWRPMGPRGRGIMLAIAALLIPVAGFAAYFSTLRGSAFSSTGPAQTVSFTSIAVVSGPGICQTAVADAGKSWKLDNTGLLPGEVCAYAITATASAANTLGVFVGCIVPDGVPSYSPLFLVGGQTDAGAAMAPGSVRVVDFTWQIGTADAGLAPANYPMKIDFPLSAPAPCS